MKKASILLMFLLSVNVYAQEKTDSLLNVLESLQARAIVAGNADEFLAIAWRISSFMADRSRYIFATWNRISIARAGEKSIFFSLTRHAISN